MAAKRITKGLIRSEDGHVRCWWPGAHADYIAYHDDEWGRPVGDDRRLFEKLCLEGFQSGLSWLTILRKRDNFRAAFADFEFERIARWNQRSVARLLTDEGIVRHRGKIESVLNNARVACELADSHGSLSAYFWSFRPADQARPRRITYASVRTLSQTAASEALSKDLKSRGFRFVGPTTMYALMQAMGLVNDHLERCWVRDSVEKERKRFIRGSR